MEMKTAKLTKANSTTVRLAKRTVRRLRTHRKYPREQDEEIVSRILDEMEAGQASLVVKKDKSTKVDENVR